MIFYMHGQALLARIETGPLWHRPALQCPVELEPEIIVQARRGMFLHDIDRPVGRRTMPEWPAGSGLFPKLRLPRYRCSCVVTVARFIVRYSFWKRRGIDAGGGGDGAGTEYPRGNE